ncbi:universal stress protein uspa-like protein [Haloferax prahovense DSM 18310]|uniref:Universal stress protein uspa-like protein n=1 Tax=Haloferax prahovense (strain DSM 18310 / JCM 13924 / TL6) TaxID=1227461 RepID=M0GAN8_HALPT|nr:universal stress protein uspa-like protein [Haloferax prahovense DSM 18310]
MLAGGRFEEWHTVAKQRADTILQQAADQAARDNRSIQVVCETGDTVETIIGYALEHEFDHIVIGNHGREGV